MKKEKNDSFIKIDYLILFLIVSIAFIFRLYKINIPLSDLHSWRQADTAAVSRNYVKDGIDLLRPHYDDLSSIQSGHENPQGLRFVEFPIYNAIVAVFNKLVPALPLEVWGRLVTSFFSLIIICIIYYLLLKENGRLAAVVGSLTFAVFPFFVFFSRVILPETTATSFAMLSIFLLYLYSNSQNLTTKIILFLLSLISFSLSLLVKPTVVFYGIALFYLFFKKYKFSLFKKIHFYIYFILALIPFFAWRYYISSYPEGIPPSDWLITSVNTYQGLKNIFLRPAFFRWIFFERLNVAIFGGYLSFFFILGIILKQKRYFFHTMLLSAFMYLFVFEGGNVQHEYYQTIILPPLAMFVGIGLSSAVNNSKYFINSILVFFISIIIFALSYFFSYYKVRDYYYYPPELPVIGKIISTLTHENDKIITDRMGDTTLLYLANRKGAPANYKSLDEFKKDNYSYFVTLNKQTIEDLKIKKTYKIIFENDQFAIFKL